MLVFLIYCVFVLMIGVSLRRPLGSLREAQRQRANLERELRALAEAPDLPAVTSAHLSPALARLFDETRLLRTALEEPLQAVRAWQAADRNPWLARVDVGDGSDLDRLEEVDVALVNARRGVWDWLGMVDDLPEADRETLARLGLSVGPVRGALEERDAFRRTSAEARKESARIERLVMHVRAGLDRFEGALSQATRAGLYR
ncbi:hypothetical protein SAMN02745121_00396 [Nannocystis exedens]|uniref:Uncharacterized protein n=1 Tax=Nannocystis exedens TaxID=54 RepID=A0A1I1T043_9BACT|nr:hypothetical protein [Nannocystis exedens]PCC66876.1 hypothetical protein NAEX_09472 [Nannocystis exedens]SFD51961.1 hypothetical protein SAMN02745121_00396 [Nannocystis exedens]